MCQILMNGTFFWLPLKWYSKTLIPELPRYLLNLVTLIRVYTLISTYLFLYSYIMTMNSDT